MCLAVPITISMFTIRQKTALTPLPKNEPTITCCRMAAALLIGGNDSNADIDNGVLKIKAGTNKLSRVSDGDGVKVKNTTQTAGTYRHPVFELGENEKFTVYLGNNGLLKEATPTGSLTVTVGTTEGDGANSDQEFIYKLILANLNGYDTLTGEYTIKIGGESSGQKIRQ